jgi:hypothetical protein
MRKIKNDRMMEQVKADLVENLQMPTLFKKEEQQ